MIYISTFSAIVAVISLCITIFNIRRTRKMESIFSLVYDLYKRIMDVYLEVAKTSKTDDSTGKMISYINSSSIVVNLNECEEIIKLIVIKFKENSIKSEKYPAIDAILIRSRAIFETITSTEPIYKNTTNNRSKK